MEFTSAFEANKAVLKKLLQKDAILFSNENISIVDKKGRPQSWIFYNWGISLTYEGCRLMANCILELLKKFEGTQIASYGMTSLPIVSSCVALGNGKYSGLAIREKREAHGTCNQIEGVGSRKEKVIVIDDCVASGTSMHKAISALEEIGYTVEGCICIVNIPSRGGFDRITSLGYKFETIFDIWKDLLIQPPQLPAHKLIFPEWDKNYQIKNGLSPADAVSLMIEHFQKTGLMAGPPLTFDNEYDGSGGIYISLRGRTDNARVARNGFMHIDSQEVDLGRDIALATYKTISGVLEKIKLLGPENLKVAVSLIGKQHPIEPKDLDFLNFGITVVSKVRPNKIGGALPNTQSFVSEMEQYAHARFHNARLLPDEPHLLYKYAITKSVQKGMKWPAFGIPAENRSSVLNNNIGILLTEFAFGIINATIDKKPLPVFKVSSYISPFPVCGVGVSIYDKGIIGCCTSRGNDIEKVLIKATIAAWDDKRFKHDRAGLDIKELSIVISLFCTEESLGKMDFKKAAKTLRLGIDTLFVYNTEKRAIMLSYVPCHHDWSKEKMAAAVLRKSGITETLSKWKTFETATWISKKNKVTRLINGYPKKEIKDISYEKCVEDISFLGQYILNQNDSRKIPKYCYWPLSNTWSESKSSVRKIFALNALYEAGNFLNKNNFRESAITGLSNFITAKQNDNKDGRSTINLDSNVEHHLLLAITKKDFLPLLLSENTGVLVNKILNFINDDGSINPAVNKKKIGHDQDFFPGVILLALSKYSTTIQDKTLLNKIDKCLEFYRRRFHLKHPWGLAWWHMQAWTSIYNLKKEKKYADFVFEIADWTLNYQIGNGSFLVEYSKNGPTFHTACVLEGIADAWSLAKEVKDEKRIKTYAAAWKAGIDFMNQLIVNEEDTFFMPKPLHAIGGVRYAPVSSMMRIDFTAHLLFAIIKGVKNL